MVRKRKLVSPVCLAAGGALVALYAAELFPVSGEILRLVATIALIAVALVATIRSLPAKVCPLTSHLSRILLCAFCGILTGLAETTREKKTENARK
jgi:hypothetical protein